MKLKRTRVFDPSGNLVLDVAAEGSVGIQGITELPFESADVGPETTRVTVPPESMEPGTAHEFEVRAVESSGNQTISGHEFETE